MGSCGIPSRCGILHGRGGPSVSCWVSLQTTPKRVPPTTVFTWLVSPAQMPRTVAFLPLSTQCPQKARVVPLMRPTNAWFPLKTANRPKKKARPCVLPASTSLRALVQAWTSRSGMSSSPASGWTARRGQRSRSQGAPQAGPMRGKSGGQKNDVRCCVLWVCFKPGLQHLIPEYLT